MRTPRPSLDDTARISLVATQFEYNIVDTMLWVLILIGFAVFFCAISSLLSFNTTPGRSFALNNPSFNGTFNLYARLFNYGD